MATIDLREFSGARLDTASRNLPNAIGTENIKQRADTQEFRPHKEPGAHPWRGSKDDRPTGVPTVFYTRGGPKFTGMNPGLLGRSTDSYPGSYVISPKTVGLEDQVVFRYGTDLVWVRRESVESDIENQINPFSPGTNALLGAGKFNFLGCPAPNSEDFSVERLQPQAATVTDPLGSMTFALTRLKLLGGDYPPDYITSGNIYDILDAADQGAYISPTVLFANTVGRSPGGHAITDHTGRTLPAGATRASAVIESAPTAFSPAILYNHDTVFRINVGDYRESDEERIIGFNQAPYYPSAWFRLYASFDGVMFSVMEFWAPVTDRRYFGIPAKYLLQRARLPLITEGTLRPKLLRGRLSENRSFGGPVMAPNGSMLTWIGNVIYPTLPNDIHRRYPDQHFTANGDVRHIEQFNDGIAVFTNNGMTIYAASSDGYFSPVTTVKNAVPASLRSISQYGGSVIYATQEGLYATGQGSTKNLLSQVWSREDWRDNRDPELVAGTVMFDRYYFTTGKYDGTNVVNREVWELDLRLEVVTKLGELPDLALPGLKDGNTASALESAGWHTVVLAVPELDGVYVGDSVTDSMTVFARVTGGYDSAKWVSKWIQLGREQVPNYFRVDADSYPVKVTVETDTAPPETQVALDQWVKPLVSGARASRMRVTIEASTVVHSVSFTDARREAPTYG